MTRLDPGAPAVLADQARQGLRTTFGAEATVVGRAPGRVNLIGEHTDYNAGLVLPVALSHATYAAAAPRGDGTVRLASSHTDELVETTLDRLGPDGLSGWGAYAGGVLWALREAGIEVPGLDLYVTSTVPLGAGLSSSAAIECAVAVAAVALAGREPDDALRELVVAACIRAETEVAGAPTGGMDQTVAVFAEDASALRIDFDSGERRVVPLALDDRVLLVTDTRVSHQLTDGGYGDRRSECDRAAAALGVATLREASEADLPRLAGEPDGDVLTRRARHIVTEIARVDQVAAALGRGDWAAVGPLFAASHASMRDDFEISTPELDLAVATATDAGADAARMTGGGFGGSTVAVVPRDLTDRVCRAVDAAFDAHGLDAPAHLVVEPATGAGVL